MERRTSASERPAEACAAAPRDVLGEQQSVNWSQLAHGMTVRFRDGGIGAIEHLWLTMPHPGVGQLVVRLAGKPSSCVVVPLDRVRLVDDLGASVDMDAAPAEALPEPAASTEP